jgi:hypothetical protein
MGAIDEGAHGLMSASHSVLIRWYVLIGRPAFFCLVHLIEIYLLVLCRPMSECFATGRWKTRLRAL